MEGLADKRLVIVVGKGGVGKTTTASALALRAADDGRNTLLVTVDPAKRLKDSLGMQVGPRPTPIQPNLHAMMLDPGDVIREHLEREVPDAKITEHPMFRYVSEYMPGLNELMAIGKLNDLRRAGSYDLIVVDTAPTGHALSFLSVPKAMRELMGERSLLKWAIRGYAVWQKLAGAARGAGNLFKKKDDRQEAPPDIDFERIFSDIQKEAEAIQAYLADPKNAALVIVTLPEKMPVEETCDIHAAITDELGMAVFGVVVNKVQPEPSAAYPGLELLIAHEGRKNWLAAAEAAGLDAAALEAMMDATHFSHVRRTMNLQHIDVLRERLPEVPLWLVPLFRSDVQGLSSLRAYAQELTAESASGSGDPV